MQEHSEKISRNPGELAFTLLTILFGCLGYYFALDISSGALSSPSVAPKIASSVIILMGLAELVRCLRKGAPQPGINNLLRYLFTWDVVFILAMLAAYSVLLPILHFPLASFLFLLASLFYLQRGRRFLLCLVISLSSIAVLIGVFTYVFKVMLP